MAPKKNEHAKDKEDKDDATPGSPTQGSSLAKGTLQVPETEPMIENEPEPEPEHEPEHEPENEPENVPEPEPEPEQEPEPEPEQEPEPEPEPKTDPRSEPKPKMKPKPETTAKLEAPAEVSDTKTPESTTGQAAGSGASGSRAIHLEPHRLELSKEMGITVTFENLILHAIQPPLASQPRFQSYYAWSLVERKVLARLLKGFALEEITVSDLTNIDQDFVNALPIGEYFAIPPALRVLHTTGAGKIRVEIADPEVKTSQGGDINMLLADRVNLVTDKDTGLPHIFSFPSEKFVAPPAEFEFRSPKLQDCNMVAQSYMVNAHQI
eukprot:jgi/Tetstr1/465163/TSEL_009885.t1